MCIAIGIGCIPYSWAVRIIMRAVMPLVGSSSSWLAGLRGSRASNITASGAGPMKQAAAKTLSGKTLSGNPRSLSGKTMSGNVRTMSGNQHVAVGVVYGSAAKALSGGGEIRAVSGADKGAYAVPLQVPQVRAVAEESMTRTDSGRSPSARGTRVAPEPRSPGGVPSRQGSIGAWAPA